MPNEISHTLYVAEMLTTATAVCKKWRHEFIMPEHVLYALLEQEKMIETLAFFDVEPDILKTHLTDWFETIEQVPEGIDYQPESSEQFEKMLKFAYLQVVSADQDVVDIPHIVSAFLGLNDSMARYELEAALRDDLGSFLNELISAYGEKDNLPEELENASFSDEEEEDPVDQPRGKTKESWRKYVVCLNDYVDEHHPLIGREAELERTIQVLCRKDKNNPLHVGEPGVGKTAIVYGLAARLKSGDVPEKLKNSRIYQLDIGTLLAGTQFRGDFEKRLKMIMEGAVKEGRAIVYIDEIHNLLGAGQTGEGSMDASNMLKPYLETGGVRFIGSTTYEEYNRYFSRSRGLVRRFQQIDIPEPSMDEAVGILKGLQEGFELFHQVRYADGTIDYAVKASAKYINDRYLPDKAIDLIDESGAYRQLHPRSEKGEENVVDKDLINEVLAKVCKVDMLAQRDDDNAVLVTLRERMMSQIYGQDGAITQVVEAIQMSKAGLTDDDKPIASLLFVGPTGVGKTEVARVLAKEMGVELVRFDMSEYTEKHTVAKLIGSPAGYVGYEDGGLLTDAIRKTPNCVLLLDEIEKAHADIYNILLQVMDYARLTDNKGRKADFRNVVLIMTSNAGAQYASQASVGFGPVVPAGEAMLRQVKRTFKPEFINRLSATVVFNDMDRKMAGLILDKKLRELQQRLTAKMVTMKLTDSTRQLLLDKGFTREYGARELDRVVAHLLKPLFMREILFGRLTQGGTATVDAVEGQLQLTQVDTDKAE